MTASTLNLIGQLIKSGLRFQYQKMTGAPGRPQAVSLEITHDCVAKCIMCNIWKIPRDVPNLAIEDWLQALSSDLFADLRELDITGGEPFTRVDLPDFFSGIYRLRRGGHLNRLKSIAVTTNGLLTDRVLNQTEKITRMLADEGIELIMVCAVDAIGDLHDRVRGVRGAWLRVERTMAGLIELGERYDNLILGLKTTVLPINVDELENIIQYANIRGLFTIISPCIITGGRYLNEDRENDLLFSKGDKDKMIRFFRKGHLPWHYHTKTLVGYLEKGEVQKPCSCGFNYFFIRSTGHLFPCPLINISLGHIKERSPADLFHSKEASRFRRKVGRFPECRRCTEPGLERYTLPYEGFHYLGLFLSMGKKAFLQMHRHMGLDKYVP